MNIDTRLFLQAIGPNSLVKRKPTLQLSANYVKLAAENDVILPYFLSLPAEVREKSQLYLQTYSRYKKIVDESSCVSSLFKKYKIPFAVMKTIKPYLGEETDVDVLILGSRNDFFKAANILASRGYSLLSRSKYTIGFRTPSGIDLDLYSELAANRLIYIDKRKLSRFTITLRLAERYITTFSSEAELLILLAHSAIKEKYTIACLLTTLHSLNNKKTLNGFLSMITDNYLREAARWYFTLTCLMCRDAYGVVPAQISRVLSEVGGPCGGAYRTYVQTDAPPYRCDFVTLIRIFRDKMKDEVFGRSFREQITKVITFDKGSQLRIVRRAIDLIR
jgi:hypothetical protein